MASSTDGSAGLLPAGLEDGPLLVAYLAAVALVEPAYVAAGFALYLGRRTVLEGWDIELEFRRLSDRIEGRVEGRPEGGRAAGSTAAGAQSG
jgi:hypothetical protein